MKVKKLKQTMQKDSALAAVESFLHLRLKQGTSKLLLGITWPHLCLTKALGQALCQAPRKGKQGVN